MDRIGEDKTEDLLAFSKLTSSASKLGQGENIIK